MSQPLIVREQGGSFSFNLGSSITITDQSPITLAPPVPSQCTEFLWTTSGTGVFADSTAKNTTYTPGIYDDTVKLQLRTKCSIGDSLIIYNTKYIFKQYEFEIENYLNKLTVDISDTTKYNQNEFVKNIKKEIDIDSLSEIIGSFYILANETSEAGLKDIVNNCDADAVNSPSFIPFEGFKSDTTSSYINSNYNPTTSNTIFNTNSASLWVYSMSDYVNYSATIAMCDMGVYTTLSNYTNIIPKSKIGSLVIQGYSRLITGSQSTITGYPTSTIGGYLVTRNKGTYDGLYGYTNNASLAMLGTGSTEDLPNENIYILARNNNGKAGNFSNRRIGGAYIGGYINKWQDFTILRNYEKYLDFYGKGLLSDYYINAYTYFNTDTITDNTYYETINIDNITILEHRHGYSLGWVHDGYILFTDDNFETYTSYYIGSITEANFAYIFSNGNCYFAADNHLYYSSDGLNTVREVQVTDIDGGIYDATMYQGQSYKKIASDRDQIFNGEECIFWTNYTNLSGNNSPTNIYYGKNNGHVDIIYQFGQNLKYLQDNGDQIGNPDNTTTTRHGHFASLHGDTLYVGTGDGSDECHLFKFNYINGEWISNKLITNSTYYKLANIIFHGDTAYIATDNPVSLLGLYKTTVSNLLDYTKWDTIRSSPYQYSLLMVEDDGEILAGCRYELLFSKDWGKTINISTFDKIKFDLTPRDDDGYYYTKPLTGLGEYGDGTIMYKIK